MLLSPRNEGSREQNVWALIGGMNGRGIWEKVAEVGSAQRRGPKMPFVAVFVYKPLTGSFRKDEMILLRLFCKGWIRTVVRRRWFFG